MGSSRDRQAAGIALGLGIAGIAAGAAWSAAMWLALTGAGLLLVWLTVANVLLWRRRSILAAAPPAPPDDAIVLHRLLLDVSPTPLVLVEAGTVRALNRAARRLFATDDRVLPAPAALTDARSTHLHHAGHRWRIDRVDLNTRTVAALIDVESEERVAEARASAEMIQVLGHELLNGLVPIVSLAECGVAAIEGGDADAVLLSEILTTLVRRADGLHRFTEAYRGLARLPPPLRAEVDLTELVDDLARLFGSRWPDVRLIATVDPGLSAAIDRDQLSQAMWALLQNAAEASAGAVEVSVAMRGGDLSMEVADDGPGIPPDQAHRIFRPFHTSKEGGSGIGLALARQIAQAHGGTLTLLQPMPPRFRVSLPQNDRTFLTSVFKNDF